MRHFSWAALLIVLAALLQSSAASASALACADVTPGAQEGSIVPATPTSVEKILPYRDACWVEWPANNRGVAGREADEQKCNTLPFTKMLEFDPDHGENFNLCVFQSVPVVFGPLPLPVPQPNPLSPSGDGSPGAATYGLQNDKPPVGFQDGCPDGELRCPADKRCYAITNVNSCCTPKGACQSGYGCFATFNNLCCPLGTHPTASGCQLPNGTFQQNGTMIPSDAYADVPAMPPLPDAGFEMTFPQDHGTPENHGAPVPPRKP